MGPRVFLRGEGCTLQRSNEGMGFTAVATDEDGVKGWRDEFTAVKWEGGSFVELIIIGVGRSV